MGGGYTSPRLLRCVCVLIKRDFNVWDEDILFQGKKKDVVEKSYVIFENLILNITEHQCVRGDTLRGSIVIVPVSYPITYQ